MGRSRGSRFYHLPFALIPKHRASQDEERLEQEIQAEKERKHREAEEAKLALARLEQKRLEDLKREEEKRLEREKSERAIRGGIRGVRGTRASTRGMRGASTSSRPGTSQVTSVVFQALTRIESAVSTSRGMPKCLPSATARPSNIARATRPL